MLRRGAAEPGWLHARKRTLTQKLKSCILTPDAFVIELKILILTLNFEFMNYDLVAFGAGPADLGI